MARLGDVLEFCAFGVWVVRPSWINPIEYTGRCFFYVLWPLTVEQMDHAIGLNREGVLMPDGRVAQD